MFSVHATFSSVLLSLGSLSNLFLVLTIFNPPGTPPLSHFSLEIFRFSQEESESWERKVFLLLFWDSSSSSARKYFITACLHTSEDSSYDISRGDINFRFITMECLLTCYFHLFGARFFVEILLWFHWKTLARHDQKCSKRSRPRGTKLFQ